MAVFASNIDPAVKTKIKNRESAISAPDTNEFNFASRQPFVVLESNAVAKNGDNSLAKYNILWGNTSPSGSSNNNFINFSRVTLDKYKPFDIGERPPPGITSVSVNNESPLGSIRRAIINFHCWNLEDLANLQVLYMNPGIHLFLQWGNILPLSKVIQIDSIFDDKGQKTIIKELLRTSRIKNKIIANDYNYDALVGICSTFSWKQNEYGGFDCTTTIISPASLVYSFAFNSPNMANNNFYLWMSGVSEIAGDKESSDKKTSEEIVAEQKQTKAVNELNTVLSEYASFKRYALTHADKTDTSNIETFFGTTGKEQYYKFITLPNNKAIGKHIKSDNSTYISFGHLCTLLNNLFLYTEAKNFFSSISSTSIKNRSKDEFLKDEGLYVLIDLDSDDVERVGYFPVCTNYRYLRSFNPSEVLIINKSAEEGNTNGNPWIQPEIRLITMLHAKGYDLNTLNFENTYASKYINFPYKTPGYEFGFGSIKKIYLNIDKVIELFNQSSQFYEFLDAILALINGSFSGVINLIKNNDEINPLKLEIVDETLVSKDITKKDDLLVLSAYSHNTLLKNLSLDANLPTAFQTAAYVGNTNINPAQKDTKIQGAFSAASNGFYDANAIFSDSKPDNSTDLIDEETQYKKSWDAVLNKPLYNTDVINDEHGFFNMFRKYTQNNDVSFIGYPIGITLNFEIDGLSGLYYGNLFTLDYLPEFLRDSICFQINNVSHDISIGNWSTKISGILRTYTEKIVIPTFTPKIIPDVDKGKMLSTHFSLKEMTITSEKVDNTPQDAYYTNLKWFCENILEKVKALNPGGNIIINSGFRSNAVNKLVGGADDSFHSLGLAADIAAFGTTNGYQSTVVGSGNPLFPIFEQIANSSAIQFDQLILEHSKISTWIHIASKLNYIGNRRQIFDLVKDTNAKIYYIINNGKLVKTT